MRTTKPHRRGFPFLPLFRRWLRRSTEVSRRALALLGRRPTVTRPVLPVRLRVEGVEDRIPAENTVGMVAAVGAVAAFANDALAAAPQPAEPFVSFHLANDTPASPPHATEQLPPTSPERIGSGAAPREATEERAASADVADEPPAPTPAAGVSAGAAAPEREGGGGSTTSTNFPTMTGVAQSSSGGSTDAFVTKLNASGASLSYSTYLGGSGSDEGHGIALDSSNKAFVVGLTQSTNFPTSVGAYQTALAGGSGQDAFVAQLSSTGARAFSTYLGGSGSDQANAVAVNYLGEPVVVGTTAATDFPEAVGAPQTAAGGSGDAFLARFSPDGLTLLAGTYWGGSGSDSGNGVALAPTGVAYLVGTTASSDLPVNAAAAQGSAGGGGDAFVARLDVHDAPPARLAAAADGGLIATPAGGDGGDPGASGFVAALTTADDLGSGGFCTPWGQRRFWSNGAGYAEGAAAGNGWAVEQLPFLLSSRGGATVAVVSGGSARYFDLSGGTYQERFFLLDQLTTSGGNFTLTDPSGAQLAFNGFGSSLAVGKRGQLLSYTDPYGNVSSVTASTSDGLPAEVQRSNTTGSTTVTESWLYTYLTTGVNAGLIANVTLRRRTNGGSWSTVRQAAYSYYDGTSSGGNAGDLEYAVVEDGSAAALGTSYYRYYKPGDTNGYPRALKYAFSPESYARLAAAFSDPTTATDSQVAPYADRALQYNSLAEVSQMVVQGTGSSTAAAGLGTYTFDYWFSSNTAGSNSWAVKVTEGLPDGNTEKFYLNAYGEVMLTAFYDAATSQTWETFHKFDTQGRTVLTAAPSAVTGYDDTHADLLNYMPTMG